MYKFLSCSGPGLSPAQLFAGLFCSSKEMSIYFGFSREETVVTYQGRYAINMICQLMNIKSGDEVLAPAYNCGAEVDPFIWTGAKVILYRVDAKARIDMQDIIKRITSATKIIYISHFFGWPQDIEDLSRLCREEEIFLVEDCALCLFSRGPRGTVGRIGDAAIYSFVKTLPTPDGGALIFKNKIVGKEMMPLQKPPFRKIIRSSLPLLKKWFMNTNRSWQHNALTRRLVTKNWMRGAVHRNMEIEREMPSGNYFDGRMIGYTASRLSQWVISGTNPGKIVETRRRNYSYLLETLRGLRAIRFLFDDLPEDICPLSFPFFVNDRNSWSHALESRGVPVGGWPSYHRGFDWKDYPEARHLKNDLLTVPVHQHLNLHHMEHIAQCIKSIAENDDHHYSR